MENEVAFRSNILADRDTLQVAADAVLAQLKAGGTGATNLNSIQAKLDAAIAAVEASRTRLDAVLAEIKAAGTTALLIDALQVRADAMLNVVLNRGLSAAGVAEGTNPATVKTVATFTFCVAGVMLTKGATDNIAIPAGTELNTPGTTAERCKWLISIDSGGTVTVTQGAIVAAASAAVLPAVPAGDVPIGWFEIETDASTTYTPGTTDNTTAGITDTYGDLSFVDDGASSLAALGALAHVATAALGATGVAALGALAHSTQAAVGSLNKYR